MAKLFRAMGKMKGILVAKLFKMNPFSNVIFTYFFPTGPVPWSLFEEVATRPPAVSRPKAAAKAGQNWDDCVVDEGSLYVYIGSIPIVIHF